MLSSEDLAVVLAALEHRSLNRAAAALGIGQSTASRRLARLEGDLGVRLFDRTPDGLLPTPFALTLAPHAELVTAHITDIERLASGEETAPQGRVRLALADGLGSHWLIPSLPDFWERHPLIELDLLTGNAVLDLVRREADVAVRFVPPTSPELVVKRLGAVETAAYVHPSLADCDPTCLRWVGFNDPSGNYAETRWMEAAGLEPERQMRVSSWHGILAAVQHGLGAGLLSPLVAEPLGLCRIDMPPVPSAPLYMVLHEALRDVPRIKAVRAWISKISDDLSS